MINLNRLNAHRIKIPGRMQSARGGAFRIVVNRVPLIVIAANDLGWDHVSVSVEGETRTPTWEEMEAVKRLFFKPGEIAMQLHPARADYVNLHPGVLHIWRPHTDPIPMPPIAMV